MSQAVDGVRAIELSDDRAGPCCPRGPAWRRTEAIGIARAPDGAGVRRRQRAQPAV